MISTTLALEHNAKPSLESESPTSPSRPVKLPLRSTSHNLGSSTIIRPRGSSRTHMSIHITGHHPSNPIWGIPLSALASSSNAYSPGNLEYLTTATFPSIPEPYRESCSLPSSTSSPATPSIPTLFYNSILHHAITVSPMTITPPMSPPALSLSSGHSEVRSSYYPPLPPSTPAELHPTLQANASNASRHNAESETSFTAALDVLDMVEAMSPHPPSSMPPLDKNSEIARFYEAQVALKTPPKSSVSLTSTEPNSALIGIDLTSFRSSSPPPEDSYQRQPSADDYSSPLTAPIRSTARPLSIYPESNFGIRSYATVSNRRNRGVSVDAQTVTSPTNSLASVGDASASSSETARDRQRKAWLQYQDQLQSKASGAV
ncbi:hypothetical protein BC829DRAFT_378430 [Chytridium lagenaria]|nr:hypothetical protein BC829DRAFT_378430 [Chytridium lagenaria]